MSAENVVDVGSRSQTSFKEDTKKEVMYQKAVDLSGLDLETKSGQKKVPRNTNINSNGISCDHILEPVPKYIKARCEVVYSNQNNAWIVLGRDRPNSRSSGYGGAGDTKAGSIDIVVGRAGYEVAKVNKVNEQIYVDPSFKLDSARIYVSQKSDVDTNFELVDGKIGNSKTKSCIALKADGVRVVAREGIKLVTGTDRKNSQGGIIRTFAGVDIIAGNDDTDLQPMVKGNNVVAAIERLAFHVDKLSGLVDAFLHTQMEYNEKIATHWHTSPFFAIPTLPSEILVPAGTKCLFDQLSKIKRGLVSFKINMAAYNITYLNVFGNKYICSRHNNVN